jgi:hypothetical protein
VASLNQFLDFLLESSRSPAKIAKRIESSGINSRNRPSTTALQTPGLLSLTTRVSLAWIPFSPLSPFSVVHFAMEDPVERVRKGTTTSRITNKGRTKPMLGVDFYSKMSCESPVCEEGYWMLLVKSSGGSNPGLGARGLEPFGNF